MKIWYVQIDASNNLVIDLLFLTLIFSKKRSKEDDKNKNKKQSIRKHIIDGSRNFP